MNSAASFLSSLRAAGISIRTQGGRLTVEAPAGVVTQRIREQLVHRKAELIEALEPETKICL